MTDKKGYNKAYHAKNADRIRAQQLLYHELNREERNRKKREYYAANKEKILQRNKAWCSANPEKRAAQASAQYKAWRPKNINKEREKSAAYRKIDPDCRKRSELRIKYNLTIAEFNNMLSAQNHKCAICERSEMVEGRRLAVDHCHETGKVRELLCTVCNMAEGMGTNTPEFSAYRLKHAART